MREAERQREKRVEGFELFLVGGEEERKRERGLGYVCGGR